MSEKQVEHSAGTHCYADLVDLTMRHAGAYEIVIDTPTPQRGISRIRCVRIEFGDERDDELPLLLWTKDMHFDKCLRLYRDILIARQEHFNRM